MGITFKHIMQDFDFEANGTANRNNRRAEFREPRWIVADQSKVVVGIGLNKHHYLEIRHLYDEVRSDMVKLKRQGQLDWTALDELLAKYTQGKVTEERRRHIVRCIGHNFQHLTNQ